METARLIEALSSPAAYPCQVNAVDVRQTHISAVFLAGPFAYKVKKPVRLPFVDFSTVEARHRFCEEEARLNRRLAPDVYLGVVPVVRAGEGLRVEGTGEAIEWAVKMRRLPDEATLHARLERGEVAVADVEAIARRLAAFHRGAERNERTLECARFEAVRKLVRDVLALGAPLAGRAVHPKAFGRLTELLEGALDRHRGLIESRAERGVPCDGHGDLRLDHVYLFGGDIVIIDCIEFSEKLRYLCPIADMAFLAMDLAYSGHRRLARAFTEEYFRASGDEEGRALLPLYTAYRAAVRGAVAAPLLAEEEVPQAQREAALKRARGRWLLALGELEVPERKPCLVLMAGLPGSGKSTVARGLPGFEVFRADVVRKEIAVSWGAGPESRDIYTSEWDDVTHAECLRRAEEVLFAGGRVIVDATFREERRRREFLDAATHWGVPCVILHCEANEETARERLGKRRGDASSADAAVWEKLAARWEPFGPETEAVRLLVDTNGTVEESVARGTAALRNAGLLE
jgi:aminoglycoside phosphotransferase family enzyme/predicted kinase